MVSGRYFFPKAPVLCLKWMPACAVTSVKTIEPDGREGCAEVGGGEADAVCVDGTGTDAGADETTCCSTGSSFLHPENPTSELSKTHATRRRNLKTIFRWPTITPPPSVSPHSHGANRA